MDIRRIGPTYPKPQPKVLFGELFSDERVEQYYEAVVGTLKSAKKRGIIDFRGQILFQGVHNNVVISIVDESPPPRTSLANIESRKTPSPTDLAEAGNSEHGGGAPSTIAPEPRTPVRPAALKPGRRRQTIGSAPASVPTTIPFGSVPLPVPVTPNQPPLRTWRSSRGFVRGAAKGDITPAPPQRPQGSMVVRAISVPNFGAFAPVRSPPMRAPSLRTSSDIACDVSARVGTEIGHLVDDIRRIGVDSEDWCLFGDLFDDDDVQQRYEALVGTLKSAKRRGVINFRGQMLLKGMHDKVRITIAPPPIGSNVGDGRKRQVTKKSVEEEAASLACVFSGENTHEG